MRQLETIKRAQVICADSFAKIKLFTINEISSPKKQFRFNPSENLSDVTYVGWQADGSG
jgi:hypothetical protein